MTIGRFHSSKDENLIYEVSKPEGEYSCTCKGFEHRKHCSHIEAVKRWIENWGLDFPGEMVFPPPAPWKVVREEGTDD